MVETETEEEGTTAVGRSGNMGFAGQFMGFPAAWGVGGWRTCRTCRTSRIPLAF